MSQPLADGVLAELGGVLERNPEMPYAQYMVQLPDRGGMYHITLTRPGVVPPQEALGATIVERDQLQGQIEPQRQAIDQLLGALNVLRDAAETLAAGNGRMEAQLRSMVDDVKSDLGAQIRALVAADVRIETEMGAANRHLSTTLSEQLQDSLSRLQSSMFDRIKEVDVSTSAGLGSLTDRIREVETSTNVKFDNLGTGIANRLREFESSVGTRFNSLEANVPAQVHDAEERLYVRLNALENDLHSKVNDVNEASIAHANNAVNELAATLAIADDQTRIELDAKFAELVRVDGATFRELGVLTTKINEAQETLSVRLHDGFREAESNLASHVKQTGADITQIQRSLADAIREIDDVRETGASLALAIENQGNHLGLVKTEMADIANRLINIYDAFVAFRDDVFAKTESIPEIMRKANELSDGVAAAHIRYGVDHEELLAHRAWLDEHRGLLSELRVDLSSFRQELAMLIDRHVAMELTQQKLKTLETSLAKAMRVVAAARQVTNDLDEDLLMSKDVRSLIRSVRNHDDLTGDEPHQGE